MPSLIWSFFFFAKIYIAMASLPPSCSCRSGPGISHFSGKVASGSYEGGSQTAASHLLLPALWMRIFFSHLEDCLAKDPFQWCSLWRTHVPCLSAKGMAATLSGHLLCRTWCCFLVTRRARVDLGRQGLGCPFAASVKCNDWMRAPGVPGLFNQHI